MAWTENATALPGRMLLWLIGWDVTLGGLAGRMNERLDLVDPNTLNCSLGHRYLFDYILQTDNSYLL